MKSSSSFSSSNINFNMAAIIILIFTLLAASGSMVVEARLCERASQTWSGTCRITSHCDNQCRKWESAFHGACHVRNKKHMCFCYFKKC